MKDEKKRGAQAFHDYYRGIYGERWEDLRAALAAPADAVPLRIGFNTRTYFLDSASVFVAESLVFPFGGRILDACAAPGGKSLVLAGRLEGEARLVCNELSGRRRRRLAAVLDEHLPSEIRARVEVTGSDAAALCRRTSASFDAILLDAPCSSERHVLADPTALDEWTPARVRNLSARQWSLLSSAFLMLREGGCLVYSTCALSPEENDNVASRLARKYGAAARYDPPSNPRAETTEKGIIFLPDKAGGAGPMYVCRIWKRPS